jgi:3-oxoacyl-(acyl-carrier-protein) synthase
MSTSIAGTGWVTPLGSGIQEVWNRLLAGDKASPQEISDPIGKRHYTAYRVPPTALKNLPSHPRLRRASAISRFAASAGLAALEEARLKPDDELSEKLALIFAVANGGVIYTKRFYSDIVNTGADAASPLLFPETVFNAAASHLSAIIGASGTTYTVVGDGTVGLTALQMGEDLLATGELDYCLVVAAEEADWLLCDAYNKWRLVRANGPLQVFQNDNNGTILSEGAGAVLLSRQGPVKIAATAAGAYFKNRRSASEVLASALTKVAAPGDGIVISSANGTFVDSAELKAMSETNTGGIVYSPKEALGEGVAAGTIWQLIVAAQSLRTQEMPRPQISKIAQSGSTSIRLSGCREITTLSCGLNQQAGATRLVVGS